MRWRLIEKDEAARFDEFLAFAEAGDILQSFIWGEVKSVDWQPFRGVVEDADGKIRAAATVLVRRLPALGRAVAYVPRGPVLDDFADTQLLSFVLEALADLARRQRAVLLKIDPGVPNNSKLANFFSSHGFLGPREINDFGGIQPRYTFILSLNGSIDDIFARFPHKLRYKINYAKKKGVVFRANDETSIEDFYTVLAKTGERNDFLTRSASYFKHLYETLKKDGRVLLLTGYLEGEPVVSSITLAFGLKAWATYGGQIPKHRNLYAYQSMNWECIRWAHSRGARWFDFDGVPGNACEEHPLYGIYHFKKSFGGEFVTFIGEWDLPLSRPLYLLWEKGLPAYKKLLRYTRSTFRR